MTTAIGYVKIIQMIKGILQFAFFMTLAWLLAFGWAIPAGYAIMYIDEYEVDRTIK